jgi:VWFA-related protein
MRGVSRPEAPLALLAAAILLALPPVAAQQQPFTAGTNLVVVPVVVVDGKGVTVSGLTETDFQVTEDGAPVAIQTFLSPSASTDEATGEPGRFIVIALDNILTSAEISFRVKSIARLFVDRMGPRDVMSVMMINGGKGATTSSKAELLAAIDRYQGSFGEQTWTGAQRTAHGLRMINSLTDQVAKATHRRKVFVFIGDAGMFSPREPSAVGGPNDLSVEWTETIRASTRNNVAIYTIDPKGLAGPPIDWSESLAEETGGSGWGRINNYKVAVDRIWQEAGSYYLIGYAAPINDRKLHKIGVKVARPGVTVRARKARG